MLIDANERITVGDLDAPDLRMVLEDSVTVDRGARVIGGRDELLIVTRRRPGWTLPAAAAVGILSFGLGAVMLLVRERSVCRVRLHRNSSPTTVEIAGRVDPVVRTRLVAALQDGAVATPGTAQVADVGPVPGELENVVVDLAPSADLTDVPMADDSLQAVPPPPPQVSDETAPLASMVAGSTPVVFPRGLRWADGSTTEIGDGVVVGRDPVSPDGRALRPIAIDDPGMSVSKTHFCISTQGESLLLRDLHSTNGTSVIAADGRLQTLDAEAPITVEPGCRIQFGDRVVEVVEIGPSQGMSA